MSDAVTGWSFLLVMAFFVGSLLYGAAHDDLQTLGKFLKRKFRGARQAERQASS